MIKNTIITAIIAGVVATLIALAVGGSSSSPQLRGSGRAPNTDATFKSLTSTATSTNASQGVPSYHNEGGVEYVSWQKSFTATSSVLCDFPNPWAAANATSTILSVVVDRTSGFVAATTFDISTSTTAVGSSTPALVYARSVAAGAKDHTIWLPSATTTNANVVPGVRSDGSSYSILGPTERITVRVATSTPGSETPSGTCSVRLMKQ